MTVGVSLLWVGFVLAISMTEEWIKFRAPFLPRHYGFDVGTPVFPVLNGVEVAFCATLWLIQFSTDGAFYCLRSSLTIVSLTLLSQVIYLMPQLVLIGKHVIHGGFSDPEPSWSAKQEQLFEELSVEVRAKVRPPLKLHLVLCSTRFL
jgi:hypothetical protein